MSGPHQAQVGVSSDFLAKLRQMLGVRADLDRAGIIAALEEVLAEQAEHVAETRVTDADSTAEEVQPASSLVAAALADGRITSKSAAFWQQSLEQDRTGRVAATLASLHRVPWLGSSEVVGPSDADAEYTALFGQEG